MVWHRTKRTWQCVRSKHILLMVREWLPWGRWCERWGSVMSRKRGKEIQEREEERKKRAKEGRRNWRKQERREDTGEEWRSRRSIKTKLQGEGAGVLAAVQDTGPWTVYCYVDTWSMNSSPSWANSLRAKSTWIAHAEELQEGGKTHKQEKYGAFKKNHTGSGSEK